MIYILDHYYVKDHVDSCIVLESDKTVQAIQEITSALEFLFEDLVRDDGLLDEQCLKLILCKYYNMTDIKEKYKKYIPLIISQVEWDDSFGVYEANDIMFIHIDLYGSREACCGDLYDVIMKKWLPKGKKRESLEKLIRERGEGI